MLKQMIAIAIAASFVSGCAMTKPTTNGPSPVDATALNTSLAAQQAALIDVINQQCQQNALPLEQLSTDVQQLQTQIADLKATTARQNAAKPVPVVATPKECAKSPLDDKLLLGEVESVFIEELGAHFATRIDTGAESSSVDARNIVLFERDGTQWVRFNVYLDGPKKAPKSIESKVVRFVRIKQDADEKDDRRPVIHAHLKIGKYVAETDLNLTDRSHLDYPLLLGRKFIKDIAIVDVGQSYVHGKAKDLVTSAQ